MQTHVSLLTLAAMAIALSSIAAAENATKPKKAATAATLYRVDEGVFDLRQGEVIDLTDRKVTLHVQQKQHPDYVEKQQRLEGRVGGDTGNQDIIIFVGQRINLKDLHVTREMFKDRSHCFVDPIGLVAPKGAPIVATFRLSCE